MSGLDMVKAAMEAAHAATVNTKDMVIDGARAISNSPGAAPLHAFVRQGADEITQALAAFPDSNIRPVAEPGQLFEPTPQLVTAEMTGRDVGLDR